MSKTFPMGGVHPDDSKISANAAIEDFPLPAVAYVSMSQHLGAPAEPVVEAGQEVKAGQLIGKPSGFISAPVHSPYSGVVKNVDYVADLSGNKAKTVVIEVSGDQWDDGIDRSGEIKRDIVLSGPEIIAKIAEKGIVGLGGATFPTSVKLSVPKGKKAEYLIVNGAECEPFITSDYRQMIEQPEQLLIGTRIMMKALSLDRAYIGIEENKPEAIEKLRGYSREYGDIEIVKLKKKYPQGGEKQLIKAVTGRNVPSMGLPIDVGAVVQNVSTAIAVYNAVQHNMPLVEKVVTVTGNCLPVQKNFRVRLGVKLSELIGHAGGVPEDCVKIISGGPMMGKAVYNTDAPVVKGTSSLLFLTRKETARRPESNCIRCASCVSACPMGLEPYLLGKLARLSKMEELEKNRVYDCIECGCCSYTCPAGIPLLDNIRLAKASVLKIMRSRPKK